MISQSNNFFMQISNPSGITFEKFIQVIDSLITLTTDRKKAIVKALLENQATDDIRNELQNALFEQMEFLKREEKMLQEDYDVKTKEYVTFMQQLSEEHSHGLQNILDEATYKFSQIEQELNTIEDEITKEEESDQLTKIRASLSN